MPRLPRATGAEHYRALLKWGCRPAGSRGSHFYLVSPKTGKRFTVPCHAGEILPTGTLKSILRDAGLTNEEYIALLGGK